MGNTARRVGRGERQANLRRLAMAVDRLNEEVERAPITPRRAGWIERRQRVEDALSTAAIWRASFGSALGDKLAREEIAAWKRYRTLWARLAGRAREERAKGFPLKRLSDWRPDIKAQAAAGSRRVDSCGHNAGQTCAGHASGGAAKSGRSSQGQADRGGA